MNIGKLILICALFCSCAHTYTYKEPNIPFDSFVRIEAKRYKANCFTCLFETGTGSGTIVSSNKILTAGHICAGIRNMVDNAQKSEILDKVLATIHDDKGQTYAAIELNIHPSEDICVIKTDRPLLTGPASLAKRRPGRGKMVWSMMAPDGVGGTGLIPVVTGHYAGGDQRTSVFTIPAHPGASGGPILNAAGEIIGLVSQINKSFHHIVLSPSLKLLKNYVNSRVN